MTARTKNRKPVPPAGSAKSVPAVKRAGAILWLLAERSTPMNLSQIAREVDTLPSTCLHILRELISSRLITFDPVQKRYRLGQGIVDLAQAVSRHDGFAEFARPHLDAIATKFDVTATATLNVDDHHMVCVAFATPPSPGSLSVTLGGRVPTLSGAAGRCIAAFGGKSVSQLRQRFAKVRWQVALSFDDWIAQVERARAEGYGEDDGDFTLGVTTLATPIFAPDGGVTRTIGIGAISAQLDAKRKGQIVTALKAAAADISRRLGQ